MNQALTTIGNTEKVSYSFSEYKSYYIFFFILFDKG